MANNELKEYNDITKKDLIRVLNEDEDTSRSKKELYAQYEDMIAEREEIEKEVVAPRPMVHIDDFLAEVGVRKELSSPQRAGFKAYMQGKHYMESYDAFVPYFEEYTES